MPSKVRALVLIALSVMAVALPSTASPADGTVSISRASLPISSEAAARTRFYAC